MFFVCRGYDMCFVCVEATMSVLVCGGHDTCLVCVKATIRVLCVCRLRNVATNGTLGFLPKRRETSTWLS